MAGIMIKSPLKNEWVAHYIGLPFKDDGLTREGLHCWGLVRLVLQEQCQLDLPSYGENSAADLVAAARFFRGDSARDPWTKVEQPQRFDVALMTAMGGEGRQRVMAGHCGVMIDNETVLHVWEATNAMQMRLDHPRIRHRVLGIYRHKALM